jgi:signal transduction histidine kinase
VQAQQRISYLPGAALGPRSDLVSALGQLQRRNAELERANAHLEETNAELLRSNDDLARFAVIASHDLAEPMRATAWFIQLLERHYGETLDERAGQWMTYALSGLDEMTTLVDGLLLYSRAGGPGAVQETVDTGAIVEEVLRVLQRAADDAGATITVEYLPPVAGDPMQIRRLFQNLLTNAIKFRDPDRAPVVTVSCERNDGECSFSVTDNGIGIEPDDRERVFRMFQQAHGETFEGSGLGLAICGRIVSGHGGHIRAEAASDAGPGTKFVFTLPTARP